MKNLERFLKNPEEYNKINDILVVIVWILILIALLSFYVAALAVLHHYGLI